MYIKPEDEARLAQKLFKYSGYAVYVVLIVCAVFVGIAVADAMDRSFDNKDRMLCDSAKVSGNEIYLDKCVCYYGGDDIRCIYKD